MCLFSAPADNSAELARQQEAARARRIAEGQTQIDQAFGQFNDPFYTGRSKAYTDYQTPQLETQYDQAKKNLVYALSRTGNLRSTTGAQRFASLDDTYNNERLGIQDRATATANDARSSVENMRSTLLNNLSSTADSDAAAQNALAQAQLLSQPTPFASLGQVFQNIAAGLSTVTGPGGLTGGSGVRLFQGGGTGVKSGSGSSMRVVG